MRIRRKNKKNKKKSTTRADFDRNYARFSSIILDLPHFKNISKSDREDIIILAKLVFNDELDSESYDFISEILHEKYLKEVR